jgi:hypothetical protein
MANGFKATPKPPPVYEFDRALLELALKPNKIRGTNGYSANGLCESCGCHNHLKKLPLGMGLVVSKTPIEKETIPFNKRYQIATDTFDLGGGFHANMRFTQRTPEWMGKSDWNKDGGYAPDYREDKFPISIVEPDPLKMDTYLEQAILDEEWASMDVLKACHYAVTAEVYDKIGQVAPREVVYKAFQQHFAGEMLFFMHNAEMPRLDSWTETLYTTPYFNNRCHEHANDYLQGKIVRVKELA